MSVIGLGRADLAEQGQCLLPVEQRGVRGLWVERMAEDQQGVGLAEAVTGVALDRQGLAGELDGPVAMVLRELDAGEDGHEGARHRCESVPGRCRAAARPRARPRAPDATPSVRAATPAGRADRGAWPA